MAKFFTAPDLDALRIPSFTKFFIGQIVSNTGTWFQNLAIALITVQATNSAAAVAIVTVAQFGPTALLGGLAGRLADSVSPRKILMGTSAIATLNTLVLAWVIAPGPTDLTAVYALMMVNGMCYAFERIASQAFVYELVGPEKLQNGVVLNTMVLAAGRSIGPAIAGTVLLLAGPVACILVNAASFLCAFLLLVAIKKSTLFERIKHDGPKPSTMATLRKVRQSRPLSVLLVVNILVTLFAMSFNVLITAVVLISFKGDGVEVGMTHAINAVGAIIAGLVLAGSKKMRVPALIGACFIITGTYVTSAAAPTLTLFMISALLLGFAHGYYQAVVYSSAQNSVAPSELGRTMSFVTMTQVGIAPIGAIWVGTLIDWTSGQTSLLVGAMVGLLCAGLVYFLVKRHEPTEPVGPTEPV